MVVKNVYCNKCGKVLEKWDIEGRYSMYRHLCYGSKYDGEELRLDLCSECLDKLIESCKILPIEIERSKGSE